MHTPQYAMLLLIDLRHPLARRFAPRQEHDTPRPGLDHGVDYLLCEALPAFSGVAVGLVRAHGETGVEEENAAVCPGGEEAASVGRGVKGRVVRFQGGVDVLQGWRSRGGRADGEAETVGLVEVVVGVLADDDGFDGRKGRVAGPFVGG